MNIEDVIEYLEDCINVLQREYREAACNSERASTYAYIIGRAQGMMQCAISDLGRIKSK